MCKYPERDETDVGVIVKILGFEVKDIVGRNGSLIDADYFRLTEVDLLINGTKKAEKNLDCILKYDFRFSVKKIAWADFELFTKHLHR